MKYRTESQVKDINIHVNMNKESKSIAKHDGEDDLLS